MDEHRLEHNGGTRSWLTKAVKHKNASDDCIAAVILIEEPNFESRILELEYINKFEVYTPLIYCLQHTLPKAINNDHILYLCIY